MTDDRLQEIKIRQLNVQNRLPQYVDASLSVLIEADVPELIEAVKELQDAARKRKQALARSWTWCRKRSL